MNCCGNNPPYYISAYGLACKKGFQGTLEEWLDSLTAFCIAQQAGFTGSKEDWARRLADPVPRFSIGKVTTVNHVSKARVEIAGTKEEPVLNFWIPKGGDYVDHNHGGSIIHPANIELTPGSTAHHGGYIDFHYNGDYDSEERDYTSRIMEAPEGVLKVNDFEIVTKEKVCDWYNLPLTFENGVAIFENSGIRYMDVIIVQRRGAIAGANMSFCTETKDGYATICTDSDVNGTIYVNVHLCRL